MEAKTIPSVFASLQERGLLSPEEVESLSAVTVARARLCVKTRAAPAPIIWPAQHCKPDLLTKCAAHFGAGLIEAEVIPQSEDDAPVYFAFEISPELLKELQPPPQPGGNGQLEAIDGNDAVAMLFPIMQKLIEGQNQTNAILAHLAHGKEDTLHHIRDALDQAFLAQVQSWKATIQTKPPTVKEMMAEATGAIKEITQANAEAVKQMRAIAPVQSEAAAYLEAIVQKATSPEVREAAVGAIRILKGGKPTPVHYNPADVDPPGHTPPMPGESEA